MVRAGAAVWKDRHRLGRATQAGLPAAAAAAAAGGDGPRRRCAAPAPRAGRPSVAAAGGAGPCRCRTVPAPWFRQCRDTRARSFAAVGAGPRRDCAPTVSSTTSPPPARVPPADATRSLVTARRFSICRPASRPTDCDGRLYACRPARSFSWPALTRTTVIFFCCSALEGGSSVVSCRPPALYLVAVCHHSFVAVAQLLFVRSSVVSCRPPALYLVAVC